VPALIFDQKRKVIAAIHAGWRGVANRIIPKTLHRLKESGSRPEDLSVYIGPHIQKMNFEVGNDVRDQIIGSLGAVPKEDRDLYFDVLDDEKSLVDLNQVVKTQLHLEGLSSEQVFILHLDTYSNEFFHSYRRDKEKSGRQISFICRTV
jgi:YfiH family protein